MITDVTTLYSNVDDFCQSFEPQWKRSLIEDRHRARNRNCSLSLSEVMTILIWFHSSRYRDFKHFYLYLLQYHRKEFPKLLSYNRFVELMPWALAGLCGYLNTRKGECTGIQFVDSTAIIVCNNKRIFNHRVFDGFAKRGKNTMGWFFGFNSYVARAGGA